MKEGEDGVRTTMQNRKSLRNVSHGAIIVVKCAGILWQGCLHYMKLNIKREKRGFQEHPRTKAPRNLGPVSFETAPPPFNDDSYNTVAGSLYRNTKIYPYTIEKQSSKAESGRLTE